MSKKEDVFKALGKLNSNINGMFDATKIYPTPTHTLAFMAKRSLQEFKEAVGEIYADQTIDYT